MTSSKKDNKSLNRSLCPADFKWTDVELLSRYISETGKILPRRLTRLTARHQRHITRAIKHARNMLLMK
jgi:small subunit ribosomal protein S18